MTSSRPLSEWVARISWEADPAPLPRVLVPNDGDDREDARGFACFASSIWRRVAIDVRLPDGPKAVVLGLANDERQQRVIELDDFGRPFLVSRRGVEMIGQLERAWPTGPFPEAIRDVLGGESVQLRWALVARLAAESAAPAPWLFSLLPWERVNELARAITKAAKGARLAPTRPLRHYFMVTGSRFSVTLEQLRDALADERFDVVDKAHTALRNQLEDIDVERLPGDTRYVLAEMLAALEQATVPRLSFRVRAAALLGAATAGIRAIGTAVIPEHPILTVPPVVFMGAEPNEISQPLLATLDLTLDHAFAASAGVAAEGSVHIFEDHVEIILARPREVSAPPVSLVVAGSQPLMGPALFAETDTEARATLRFPEGTNLLDVLRLEFFVSDEPAPPLPPPSRGAT